MDVTFESSDDTFLDGTFVDLRTNDKISKTFTLYNYLAYDDGASEYAVGVNSRGSQVAVQFWMQVPDTLTHVDIYFPNIAPLSEGEILNLLVYKSLETSPVRTQSIKINTAQKINQFTRYTLNNPIIVSDTFYIAYEQNSNKYIGIGFDRNNATASQYIFENITGEWKRNTRLSGAIMIRPVFDSTSRSILSRELPVSLEVYPNPIKDELYITGEYESIVVLDLFGKEVFRENAQDIYYLGRLRKGIYMLRILRKEGMEHRKIVVE